MRLSMKNMISGHPENAGVFPPISKGIPTVISQKTMVFSSFRKLMKNPENSPKIDENGGKFGKPRFSAKMMKIHKSFRCVFGL